MIGSSFARANGISGKVTYVFSLGIRFTHGIFHNSGNVSQVKDIGLGQTFPPQMVVDFIKNAVPKVSVKAIGIAIAGPVNKGVVSFAPNIWGPAIKDFPLAEELERIFKFPVEVVNNVTARALFEKCYGHAKFADSFGVITIDKGVGFKQYSNGRVLVGPDGQDGEIGHLTVNENSRRPCGCGGFGHLETDVSELAAFRIVQERSVSRAEAFRASQLYQQVAGKAADLNAEHIARAAKAGDAFTLAMLDTLCKPLAQIICNLQMADPPEKYLITGDFADTVGAPYFQALERQIKQIIPGGNQLIMPGLADKKAYLVGAGLAALNRLAA
ncbi:MAG: ROK family protein [Candidatus Saganbacteria bacterium]|nr:ROK family protein [Candidatus Saganbacteria bacterium]